MDCDNARSTAEVLYGQLPWLLPLSYFFNTLAFAKLAAGSLSEGATICSTFLKTALSIRTSESCDVELVWLPLHPERLIFLSS